MDKIINKYFKGQCSDSEKEALFDWIDQSLENQLYFDRMHKLRDIRLLSENTTGNPDEMENAYLKLHERIKKRTPAFFYIKHKGITKIFRYAAVAVIMIGIGSLIFFTQHNKNDQWQTINVPHGQRITLSLSDGTVVYLNALSQFSYPKTFKGKRTVKLNGEGYFQVSKNGYPFEVETKHVNIKVTGTKFNVYAFDQEKTVEATLLEGKIEFCENKTDGFHMKMFPRQKLIFDANTFQKQVIDNIDTDATISWTNGIYNFENISFQDLITRLERYYKVKITVLNPGILNYEYTGKFRESETITDILDVIRISKPFQYKIEETKITIY